MPPYAANWAFFLDIDGTLLDIEGHPDDVHIGRAELDLVSGLHRATGGALALVSGRPLAGIDVMFHPLKLPSAGQHGAERRDGSGKRHRHQFPVEVLHQAAASMRKFAARNEGMVFEDKGASVALQFRTVVNGRDRFYEVQRSWHLRDGRLRKDLRVSRDGQYDQWTSENWHQLVEDLVPIEKVDDDATR